MTYSVAIPAFNASATIKETLLSILAQTASPSEIVVVDDGSSDDTAQIAASISELVRVIRQENTGCGQACNRAIQETKEAIVATVDADDLWLPTKMARQIEVLKAAKDHTIIFANHRQFRHGSDDHLSGEVREGLTRSDLVFYRSDFERIGDIIDPPGGRGEMIDWLARAREAGCHFEIVNDVLVLRRIIPGSLSYGRDASKDRGYLAVAYRAIQRRKQRDNEGDLS